jgi:hypothetical protein
MGEVETPRGTCARSAIGRMALGRQRRRGVKRKMDLKSGKYPNSSLQLHPKKTVSVTKPAPVFLQKSWPSLSGKGGEKRSAWFQKYTPYARTAVGEGTLAHTTHPREERADQ